jgi:predicted TPR repeat methyltransferase
MSFFFSSGDMTLDKRYDYALMYKEAGDVEAACDILAQTLEKRPDWLPALSLYGDCLAKMNNPKAKEVYAQLTNLDTQDLFGGALKLARLKGESKEMSHEYVRGLFDSYAPKFEQALVQDLNYKGPELILKALHKNGFTQAKAILDLGCGTGLMGELLEAKILEGVDLSPHMISIAHKKNIYSKLHVGDMFEFLNSSPQNYDLIIAADVFVYVGALLPLLKAIRTRITTGYLAFSVQAGLEPIKLGEDLRFSHSENYLRQTLKDTGFNLLALEACVTRLDAGKEVKGFILISQPA